MVSMIMMGRVTRRNPSTRLADAKLAQGYFHARRAENKNGWLARTRRITAQRAIDATGTSGKDA